MGNWLLIATARLARLLTHHGPAWARRDGGASRAPSGAGFQSLGAGCHRCGVPLATGRSVGVVEPEHGEREVETQPLEDSHRSTSRKAGQRCRRFLGRSSNVPPTRGCGLSRRRCATPKAHHSFTSRLQHVLRDSRRQNATRSGGWQMSDRRIRDASRSQHTLRL